MLSLVHDSGLGAIFEVEEVNNDLKTALLNKYDTLISEETVKISKKLLKRRHFPFPTNSINAVKFKNEAE